MRQAKKIFTRMCLNNWGGIDHKILEFNEYVNLFSGKSGSGKSTVMDAVQVILYGSFSSAFLNKAADDAKNRRSVLSYLRGEQKDGSANRAAQDFCSVIALEVTDTGSHVVSCMGIAFEVRRGDTELKKYQFFSHSGKMPENGYLTEDGVPFSNADIRALVEERQKSADNRGRGDINRVYASREAYLGVLYDVILGYIDGPRFITMEKSAIALRMSNGTGQFIRDYMFPASRADTIEKISDQLGAYRDIREKINDLKERIDDLSVIEEAGRKKTMAESDIYHANAVIRCVEMQEIRDKIEDGKASLMENHKAQQEKQDALEEIRREKEACNEALIQVKADLQSSDLGSRRQHLKDLESRRDMLNASSRQWKNIVRGLDRWGDDPYVGEYISNPLLNMIEALKDGAVSEEDIKKLRDRLADEKENIESEYEDYNSRRRELAKDLKEKQAMLDAMAQGVKPYPDVLKKARQTLERRLSEAFGRPVHVHVFADLFDIRDEKWKDAVEGRLGRLKFSLITEPQYAFDAAKLFRSLKKYENVDLINSEAILKSEPDAWGNSLYEAVDAKEDYVDGCLKRYLGHIVKCETVEELEAVRDGVTPDCYSYSNFIFRHLKEEDYKRRACIGCKVSRTKQTELEEELKEQKKELSKLSELTDGIRASREFESLRQEPADLSALSKAGDEIAVVNEAIEEQKKEIQVLVEGSFKELDAKRRELEQTLSEIGSREAAAQGELTALVRKEGNRQRELDELAELFEQKNLSYVANERIEEEVKEAMKNSSGQALKNAKLREVTELQNKLQNETENLSLARNRFIQKYPSCGFNGMEKSNAPYEKLLNDYRNDYEPQYQEEFTKQCDFIYKSLRDNVIATIHGDIKAAIRHKNEINRLLRKTNFSDSTYQIKIGPAENENGQFYDMLMAEELDSKNIGSDVMDGQLSFGEDVFFQKYEKQIDLLTEKFMPVRGNDDERQIERRRKEIEQYADYRNYLSFSMYEQVTDEAGNVIRENHVDDMAGRDSGGEGQNPKYVALLAGFAMLYMQQSSRDSRIRLVLLDEAFSKMDQERSAVCLKYARQMELQLIVCVPDERLQSLIRNVDCVYGFRRHNNKISMMHIDKGDYLKLMEGLETSQEVYDMEEA